MAQSALGAVIIVADAGDPIDAPMLDLNYYGRKSSRGATAFGGDPRLSWVAGLPALRIPSQRRGGENPVTLLRADYDAWRLDHPPDDSDCGMGTSTGVAEGDTTATSGDLGTEEVGDGTAGPADDSTTAPSSASDASASDASASDASASDASASEGSSGGASSGANEDGGCGCTVATLLGPWWPLIVLAWRRRQRLRTTL